MAFTLCNWGLVKFQNNFIHTETKDLSDYIDFLFNYMVMVRFYFFFMKVLIIQPLILIFVWLGNMAILLVM